MSESMEPGKAGEMKEIVKCPHEYTEYGVCNKCVEVIERAAHERGRKEGLLRGAEIATKHGRDREGMKDHEVAGECFCIAQGIQAEAGKSCVE